MNFVIMGQMIAPSASGNATTYGLVSELDARGHHVLFLERNASSSVRKHVGSKGLDANGRTSSYRSVAELKQRYAKSIREADVVIVGSSVPEGVEVGKWVTRTARGVTAFCDIDTPVTLSKLKTGDADSITRALIPKYDLYLSFTGGPALVRLERDYGARMARALSYRTAAQRAAQLERFVAEAVTGRPMA